MVLLLSPHVRRVDGVSHRCSNRYPHQRIAQVNISFMTVTRNKRGQDAIMAIGIDDEPPEDGNFMRKIKELKAITEWCAWELKVWNASFY